jgi:succinoglycan biosynthesis protein ExoA
MMTTRTGPLPRYDDSQTSGASQWPCVSVIMPVRNEVAYIGDALDQILAQDYPSDRLEIIVADGMSDDGTRDVLSAYAANHARIKVVDNADRVTPAGLNAAITVSSGELVARIDGHCKVAPDFIRQSVELLREHPEAWAVGGPIVHAGRNVFGKAVALAMSHPAGVGFATHRFAGFEGYVEGAQFPMFRRWVFDRVGLFDEALVRNQDDELNYRIALAGGKIFVSPRIRYVYYVRDRFMQLAKQYFQYSFWRMPVMRKHGRPTTPRQVVPPLFFLVVLTIAVAGVALGRPLFAFALPLAYLAGLSIVGLGALPRRGAVTALLLPAAIATMHVAYAAGFMYALYALLFNRTAWDTHGQMTTISR